MRRAAMYWAAPALRRSDLSRQMAFHHDSAIDASNAEPSLKERWDSDCYAPGVTKEARTCNYQNHHTATCGRRSGGSSRVSRWSVARGSASGLATTRAISTTFRKVARSSGPLRRSARLDA